MRLPWLQIDQDGLNRCRLLARLLAIPEAQGIGIGVSLWQWALEMAPDGDFAGLVPDSGVLAAAVGWSVPDSGRLITELQRVGLVATTPTLRVRGLERYRRAWEKNTRGKRKTLKSGPSLPEDGANPAPVSPVSAPQTQTQTQTHTEEKNVRTSEPDQLDDTVTLDMRRPPVNANVEQPRKRRPCEIIDTTGEPEPAPEPVPVVAGPAVYEKPTLDPELWSSAEEFWAWAQAKRQEAGLLGERERPRGLSSWWSVARQSTSAASLLASFEGFMREEHWQKATPPNPVRGFLKQWERWVPRQAPKPPPRVDGDAWAELRAAVFEKLPEGAGFVATQLQSLRWRRADGGFVGVTEDPFHAAYIAEHWPQLLSELAISIDAPAGGAS